MTPLEFVNLDPEGFMNLFGTRKISPDETLDIIEKNVSRVIRGAWRITKVSKGLKVSIKIMHKKLKIIQCTYLDTSIDIYTYEEETVIYKSHLVITNK